MTDFRKISFPRCACRLAVLGFDVTGVDPAAASLQVARHKRGAERVGWVDGTLADIPSLPVDLATMTGNVAQILVRDEEWTDALSRIHAALRA